MGRIGIFQQPRGVAALRQRTGELVRAGLHCAVPQHIQEVSKEEKHVF